MLLTNGANLLIPAHRGVPGVAPLLRLVPGPLRISDPLPRPSC
ncbi:hypothetical protein QJS66_17910 [Kocuria rhizophila]|nr:hypothetical protein QJS66_17910 [Kocuria rhizophila]